MLASKRKFSTCCLLFSLLALASPSNSQTFAPIQEIVYPSLPPGGIVPRYGFGFLASISLDRHSITLFGPNGQLIFHKHLRDNDGVLLRAVDISVSPRGHVAISATAIRPDGATASVLAFLNSTGDIIRLVRTEGFAARRIRFAAENELWTLGMSKSTGPESIPSRHFVRVYDQQGTLRREVLPLAELEGERYPFADSLLVPTPQGMAVFIPGLSRLYVYSNGGATPPRIATLAIPSGFELFTAALPNQEQFFLQGNMPDPAQPKKEISATLRYAPFTSDPRPRILSGPAAGIVGVANSSLVLYSQSRLTLGNYAD